MCGSGGEGPDSYLSNAETPSRRHLEHKTNPKRKTRDTVCASQVEQAAREEDESSPRGAKPPEVDGGDPLKKAESS